jgi:transcriptional regulator with XRE-family HTH domain
MGYNWAVPSARDPEAIYRVFGRKLREVRVGKRIPQQELATLSGLTRASITNIESGRQRVLLHQAVQFAEALGVDLAEIVPQDSEINSGRESASSEEEYLRVLRENLVAELHKARRSRSRTRRADR